MFRRSELLQLFSATPAWPVQVAPLTSHASMEPLQEGIPLAPQVRGTILAYADALIPSLMNGPGCLTR
jgi:hypothetical protein